MPESLPRWRVSVPLAAIHAEPRADSEMTSQLLHGEAFDVLKQAEGGWLGVQAVHDGYVGYVEQSKAAPHGDFAPGNRFSAVQGHIYSLPDFKSPPLSPLFFLSPLDLAEDETNGFRALEGGGWVFAAHIAPPGWRAPDLAETALRFLETPYLWGGRSRAGLDCSGLAQLCVMAAGHPCPRDTGEQAEAGREVRDAPRRGDLVFFKGHVGVMLDERRLINATARHMSTVAEDLQTVAAAYGGVLGVRRL